MFRPRSWIECVEWFAQQRRAVLTVKTWEVEKENERERVEVEIGHEWDELGARDWASKRFDDDESSWSQ